MKARIVKKEYLNEDLLLPFYKYLEEKKIEIVDEIISADIMITLGEMEQFCQQLKKY